MAADGPDPSGGAGGGWAPPSPSSVPVPPGTVPPPPPGWTTAPPPGTTAPGAPGGPAGVAIRSAPPLPKAGSARTGPLPLHPMGLGDVIDGAFKLLRANAALVLLLTLAFLGPVQVLAAYLQRRSLGAFDLLFDPSTFEAADPEQLNRQLDQQLGDSIAVMVASLVSLLVLPFVTGAIARVVGDSYLGRTPSMGVALRATARRWWALLAAWFLVHVVELSGAIVGGLVLAAGIAADSLALVFLGGALVLAGLVLAVFLMAWFVMVAPAIVMEDIGPVAAMRRSVRLTRGRFWPVLGIALLTGLLANVLGSVLSGVPSVLAFVVGEAGWLLLALGGVISALISIPIVAIVSTLVYFDGRIRREGFDLEVMAADLARAGR